MNRNREEEQLRAGMRKGKVGRSKHPRMEVGMARYPSSPRLSTDDLEKACDYCVCDCTMETAALNSTLWTQRRVSCHHETQVLQPTSCEALALYPRDAISKQPLSLCIS